MARLPNFLVIIRSEKLSGKGQGRGCLGVRKKERFVLGKRTFRSQKSKHFVLRIIYMLESNGKHYFVTHGDVFDKVTTQMKWLAKLGDIGYTLLLWLNSQYNRWRIKQGKPYYSLSQEIKQKVKSAVSYISDFEKVLAEFARKRQCDGVICGHIHHPENKMIGGIHYLNSGDWVETLSALTEDENGNWNILYYTPDMADENGEMEDNNRVLTLIPAAS